MNTPDTHNASNTHDAHYAPNAHNAPDAHCLADAMLPYRKRIVEKICELVRIRSVKEAPLPGMPFGQGCADALHCALRMGEEMGFVTKNIDNYAGHIEYGEGEEIVGVLNHLDVVSEGTGWTLPPYGAVMRDGRIYGRGTSDNKGPAVVSLFCLLAIKELGVPLKRRIRVIYGTDEESGWEDMKVYLQREPVPNLGFSPDAGYPMCNREKGILCLRFTTGEAFVPGSDSFIQSIRGGNARNSVPDRCTAELCVNDEALLGVIEARLQQYGGSVVARDGRTVTLETKGVPAHGANPSAGVNAVARMLALLEPAFADKTDAHSRFLQFAHTKLGTETDGASLNVAAWDEPSGPLTLNLGIFRYCASDAHLIVDIRFPVTHTMEAVVKGATDVASAHGVAVEVEKYTAPLYVPADSPLIRTLTETYERITGLSGEPMSMGGGTYARVLNNNGVAFGPGFPGGPDTHGHQADEFCVIDDLMRHARVCVEAMVGLANC